VIDSDRLNRSAPLNGDSLKTQSGNGCIRVSVNIFEQRSAYILSYAKRAPSIRFGRDFREREGLTDQITVATIGSSTG